jgi:hypothetical protein
MIMDMKRRQRLMGLATLTMALVAAGCASYSPAGLPVGASTDDAERALGAASGRYSLPDSGRRLEFARGPAGKHTFMLDFDAQGGLVSWEQVLTPARFATIEPGLTENEVLVRLGHPASILSIPRQKLRVWNYQYFNNDCTWFQVSISDEGRVLQAGVSADPKCDGGRDRSGT